MRNLKRRFKRFTAIALAVLMVVTTVDLSTFAVSAAGEGSGTYCEHHTEHTPECGYTEGIEGSPCTHEHGEECYSEVTVCVHGHDESCGYVEGVEDSCTHICSLENGCIISALNCTHEHDEACGYQAAVEGTPCIFECEECADASNDGSDTVSGNEVSDETTECTCETDDPAFHATNCPAYIAPENPQCYCAEKCTEDTLNIWCDVCGVQGVSACQGTDTAVTYDAATPDFSAAKVLTAVDGVPCIDDVAITDRTLPAGDYKLESDITTNIHVFTEGSINIDLNGHTWNMSDKNLRIDNGVTLSLYDTSGEGTGKITTSYMQTVYVVGSGSTFNLYSGTVENTSNEVNARGVSSDYGSSNLYGGTIQSNAYAVFYYLSQNITINIDNTSFECGAGYAQIRTTLSSNGEPCAVIDVSDYTGGALTVDASTSKAAVIKIFTGIQSAQDAENYKINFSCGANKDFFKEKEEYEEDGGNKYVYVSAPSFTTQPTEENDYTVAFNHPDATLQWWEITVYDSATYSEEDGDQVKSYEVNAGDTLIASISECSDDFDVTFDCSYNEESSSMHLDSLRKTASVTFDSACSVNVNVMLSPDGTGEYKIEHVRYTELEGETNVQLSKTECETTYVCKATVGEREYYSDGVTIEQEHSYTCTATSDNVITKECANCGKSGTLTITAEGGIYDGTTAYGATVEKTGILENEEVTVNYYQGDTLIGTDAPVDAGTYTAKITYEEKTASVTYTIKTTPTADMFTYTSSAEYDGTEKSANVVVKDGITGIGAITNIKYYQNGEATTPVNAGEYTVKIDVADGDIYDAATDIEVGTFTITKATPTLDMFTATPSSELVYDGTEKSIIVTTDKVGMGTFTVSYISVTDSTQPVEPVEAGLYIVLLHIEEGDNYIADDTLSFVPFEIRKADSVITAAPTPADLVYDGTAQNLINAGTATGGEMQYSLDGTNYSPAIPTGTDAGEYTVWYKVVGDKNHNDTEPASIEVTIAKGTPDIGTVSASNLENTLEVSEVVLSRSNETVHGTLSLADGTTLQYGIHDYTYVFTPNDNTNYETVTGTVSITITDTNAPTATYKVGTDGWKQFINTITFGHFCKDYTTVDITYSDEGSGVADKQYYISEEEITNTENIQWSDYTDTLNINATGKYYIYVRVTDNYGNVVIQNSEGIVVYAESVITPTSFSCEYGDENALNVNISTNGNTFANLTDGSGNEIATDNYSIDGSTLTIKGEYLSDLDVGEYTYKICMNPQGVENTEATLAYSFVVNVTAKELTVTGATATSRDYIANDKTVDITGITLSGIQGTDDVSVEITGLKGTLSSANAGTYTSLTLPALTLTGADKGNYELVQPTGPVTVLVGIEKLNAEIIVEYPAHGKIFGDPPFSLGVSDNNPEAEVTYESDDEDVATVTSEGIVTIHKAGSAQITVSLAESTNYIFADSKQIAVDVAQKDGYTVDTIQRNYLYSRENADTIDLSAYLPADCGEVTYGTPAVREGQIFSVAPTMNGSVLGYSVAVGEVSAAAQITVTVKSDNYADFTITVVPVLVDQLPVSPKTEVTFTNDTITYGDELSEMSFEEVVFEDEAGNAVEGTLAWKEATLKPEAGTTSATWVFTPDNEEYAVKEGSVAIVVKKATPVVVAPTVTERVYNPSAVLADSELSGGSATGVDGNDLNGSWSWKVSGTVPVVNNSGYEAVFTPVDINNYETVTETIRVKVNQATPVIAQVNGTTITYGDSLAASTVSGQAKHSDSVDMAVAGSFSWKDTTVKPAVADSDTTAFEVVFTPADSVNYKAVETTAKITVNKAPVAPNKPESSLNVPYTTGTVGETDLPTGWTWQNGETALEVGVVCNAVAVYTGTDAGNYETESVTVAITRAACVHDGETELRDEEEESCTEDGYTGDTYCLICEEKLATGEAIPATGHKDADKDHDCDYGCDKVFGTCEDTDKDHDCDYGCDKVFGTCEDTDKDHDCDYGCSKVFGTCEDTDKDHDCDYGCSKVFGTCEDTDKDHDCDYGCDKVYGTCEDVDKDHDCDYGCSKVFGTCEDTDKDHDCEYGCSKVFGTCEDTDKDHDCDYGCSKVFGTCTDAEKDGDHSCDYGCGKALTTCSGGTATCATKATCEECGKEYGSVDINNHTGKILVLDAVAANCTEEGYTGDTYCKDCGVKLQAGQKIPTTEHTDEDKNQICDDCQADLSTPSAPTFVDVKENKWYYSYVNYVVMKGILSGKKVNEDGSIYYEPDNTMTRAEFAQVLYNAEGKPAVEYAEKFVDVKNGKWYTNAIMWASEKGIVTGYGNGSFGVSDPITREQMVTMLYKYAQYKGYDISGDCELGTYSDSTSISGWAVKYMKWAVANNVMKGKKEKLDPIGNATRAECATMLKNFMDRYEK